MLTLWPGDLVCAEGKYLEPSPLGRGQCEGGVERRAAIFIGPEFGTVSRPDLVSAAREAGDSGFDVLIACAFNYDAHSSEFDKLGRIPVLKAHMNADLHMAADLKNTGKGNLFVIFGEPDIDILESEAGQVRVKVNGVDVFHPNTGEVRSDGAEGIALFKKNSAEIKLVILDVEMPGISGDKVFQILRGITPGVKILIASGYGKEYLETTIFKSKISHFLPKPFKIEQLSYKVNQLLGGNHV